MINIYINNKTGGSMKRYLIFILSAFFLFSCGEDGKDGVDGATGTDGALINITAEPAETENCDGKGGTKIETGIDVNDDGVLNEDEITSTQFICNGETGGNGTAGENGSNGNNSLVKTTEEPEGTENCDGKGGKKIEVGTDDNGDGELQDEEVDASTFVCNEGENIYFGDIYIQYKEDIDALADYDMVVGDITVAPSIYDAASNDAVTEIIFPNLSKVAGSIYFGMAMYLKKGTKIDGPDFPVTKISMPKLETVTGALNISYFNRLTTVELPVLNEVGAAMSMMPTLKKDAGPFRNSGLYIAYNSSIETLDLSSLTKGAVIIERNDALKSVDLTGMTNASTSYLYFVNNHVLDTINISNLTEIAAIQFAALPLITSIDLSKLNSLPNTNLIFYQMAGLTEVKLPNLIKIGLLVFDTLASMTKIELPKLVETEGFHILSNPELIEVSLPELTSAYSLNFNNNAKIVSLDLPKIKNIDDHLSIQNNALLENLNVPLLESVGTDSFTFTNNVSFSECTLFNILKTFTTLPTNTTVSNNKACNYYEFNTEEQSGNIITENFAGIMNSSSWSVAEKFVIPDSATDIYPHIYRGEKNSDIIGNFKIKADPVTNTVTADVYDGTNWVTVSVTDASVVKKDIISVVLNYDASATTLTLYVNGKTDASTGSKTLAAIDDSTGSPYLFIAVSGNGEYVDYMPHGLMNTLFIKRALTSGEITDYTSKPENTPAITDAEYYDINIMGTTPSVPTPFSVDGDSAHYSILHLLGINNNI